MWAFWAALAAMLVGLLGVLLPAIPGVALIWLVALIYAVAERFATIDPITFVIITVLGAIGVTADLWMSQTGARIGGASIRSMLIGLGAGLIGALLGALFLGIGAVPGALVGTLIGIFLAEYYRREDWREALKVAGAWLIGCTLSSVVQLFLGIVMIAIFIWQVLKG
jgi:uncharacterized protein YqgC (DUF456 family)